MVNRLRGPSLNLLGRNPAQAAGDQPPSLLRTGCDKHSRTSLQTLNASLVTMDDLIHPKMA